MSRTLVRSLVRQVVTVGSVCFVVLACGNESSEPNIKPIRDTAFDSVFVQLRQFYLEEPFADPIAGIRDIKPTGPDGRLLVIDSNRDEVRIHDLDGALLGIIGRSGEGPGELKRPVQAVMDDAGFLYVAQWQGARITRFGPDLAFDTLFRVPAMAIGRMEPMGSSFVLKIHVEGTLETLMVISRQGKPLRRFHKSHSLRWSVPYWVSFFAEEFAVGGHIYVADQFTYPMYMYDRSGALVDTFGTAPASWVPPSHPKRGAFTGVDGMNRLMEWLPSFTWIHHLGVYQDSLLFVTHARYEPQPGRVHNYVDTNMDVYDLDGLKLYEDIALPGRVLRAEDWLYLLLAEPPEGWLVGVYKLRTTAAPESG